MGRQGSHAVASLALLITTTLDLTHKNIDGVKEG
jgi:hypothetical protein